jgi:hypothetical protein
LLDISGLDAEDLRCAGLRPAWPTDPFADLESRDRSAALCKAAPPRRRRKPSLAELIERAERAGKRVTSIVTADGTTIHFDEPKPSDASNPWLDDLKVTKP